MRHDGAPNKLSLNDSREVSLIPIVHSVKQVQRRLDKSKMAELVAGYKAGETVYQLAHRFGIHRETVAIALERQGVSRRRRSLTPVQVAQAASLYEMGPALTRIAPQLGCHPDRIRRALGKAGITATRQSRSATTAARTPEPVSP